MPTLGIIAGLGHLPVSVAEAAETDGKTVHIIRIAGFEEPALERFKCETMGIGQLGRQIKRLKKLGCDEVVFAGIVKRPEFSKIKLDLHGARVLPKVLKAARQGDDALLRVIINEYEQAGLNVIAAEEAAAGLRATEGLIFGSEPDETAMRDLRKAATIAAEIGKLDIGQGCVVCDGLVAAVEAQEGTDSMLERVASLDVAVRGSINHKRGVLVKRPKPIQERRIDLPTIGPGTLERVAEAGLAGIGVEAGGALLLNKGKLGDLCDRYGIFVFGFPSNWE
ncbi:LpxI family protein [Henriciella litoralis]|uniref:LpxI family protein n=1 Tax=Henriciella litoralis TaxID=568102 RepID=UPI000A0141B7|nr:UDP-2,3-diacylglucosamine diphosphatase LpxI [Henriciella litoralis]